MTGISDFGQFATLRADAVRDQSGTLDEVARQFESLFLQQMLKSMRQASFGDPIFGDNPGTNMFRDLFDQQVAGDISAGRGIGLADLLVRQLGGTGRVAATAPQAIPLDPAAPRLPVPPPAATTRPTAVAGRLHSTAPAAADPPGAATRTDAKPSWQSPREFVRDILPAARAAAGKLGVSPLALLSQAALETGWGRHVMTDDTGDSSLNLFGIKARAGAGEAATRRRTLEFEDGVPSFRNELFRVYESVEDTFSDYVDLISGSPRYRAAVGRGDDVSGFARSLQTGGYATDPAYADKLVRVAGGDTMREVLHSLKQTDLLSLTLNVR
jgi:flagellar protein FlgJ